MRLSSIISRYLVGLALITALSPAQVAEKANRGYQTEEDRQRVARNLDNPDRVERQKPRELLQSIGVEKGDVIADIGTGVGFMLPYFVEAVGPEGMIYAEDIEEDFLAKAREKIEENGWKNVKTVKGEQKDVRLPEKTVDLAFILDVYHHFNYPQDTLGSIRRALKPTGRLAIIDFYRSRDHPRMSDERLKDHIRKDRDGFAAEVESAGFRLVKQFDHLPYQYVLIFEKE